MTRSTEPPRTPTGIRLEVSDALLQTFLDEDLGRPPVDVTSDPLLGADVPGRAEMIAREDLVVSGLDEAVRLFALCGAMASPRVADGDEVASGTVLLEVAGPARSILHAERTALNLVARMSGIASLTRELQNAIVAVAPDCQVAATRKTTPGLRMLEKRAVAHGGGDPHRFGLYDQVLLKDNHRAAIGDLATALATLHRVHPDLIVEVEVEDLTDAETAARAGVDLILIDNQTPEGCARIAARIRSLSPKTRIEASGGITAANAIAYAPHVDRISMGRLTQGAPAKDVGLDWR